MATSGRSQVFATLLFDVMIPAELAEAMRAYEYDVLEARKLPPEIQQDDIKLLALAARQGRVLVTCNYSDPKSNLVTIHREWRSIGKTHAGIILVAQFQVSSHSGRWRVRDRLLDLLNEHTWDEFVNELVWLP